MSSMEQRIQTLKGLLNHQMQDGNWNYDPYMHGLTNGLILALSIIEDKDVDYLPEPERWVCEEAEQAEIMLDKLIEEDLVSCKEAVKGWDHG